jgi:hypothetical protein
MLNKISLSLYLIWIKLFPSGFNAIPNILILCRHPPLFFLPQYSFFSAAACHITYLSIIIQSTDFE